MVANTELLDEHRIRDITRNKASMIRSLSELFARELPGMLAGINAARSDGDRDALAQAVHKLKSALGNFATGEFYQEVANLEHNAHQQDLELWQADWLSTRESLDSLMQQLDLLGRETQ